MKCKIVTCRPIKVNMATVAVLLVLVLTLMSGCSQKSGTGVIVAGSTSVQPYAEVLAEEYMILHPDAEVDIQGGGSAAGITAAQSGTADIGMSSRALKEEEKGLWYVEIARDGLAVVVNPANPVQDLTLDQVRGIYSETITNWRDVGGPDHKIHV